MIISGAATALTWINISVCSGVGYRTISRYFRLSQPYWVHAFACGGSHHFPSLSSSLLPPPSPLSLQYLCYSVISLQAGGRHTLMLFCCTCWRFSTATLCLSFALSSSLQPVPPCAAATARSGMGYFSDTALLHCYSSASVSLVAFSLLLSLTRWSLTTLKASITKEDDNGEDRETTETRRFFFSNCFILHRLWFCALSEHSRGNNWLRESFQKEFILIVLLYYSFLGHSAEDRRGRGWEQDFGFLLILNIHRWFIDWTQVTELSWHQWTGVFPAAWDQEIYFILVW